MIKHYRLLQCSMNKVADADAALLTDRIALVGILP